MQGPTIVALLIGAFVAASYGQVLTNDRAAMDSIVSKHNSLRAQPFSGFYGSDTVEVSWDDALATLAQTWADAMCLSGVLSDQSAEARTVPGLNGGIGQNVGGYSSSQRVDVPEALESLIQGWYNENQTVGLDQINPFSEEAAAKAGRFTQMVWATTHRIGCGGCVTGENMEKFFLVCDYFKAGNVFGANTFNAGEQVGSDCPPGTSAGGSNGLCRIVDEAEFIKYAG